MKRVAEWQQIQSRNQRPSVTRQATCRVTRSKWFRRLVLIPLWIVSPFRGHPLPGGNADVSIQIDEFRSICPGQLTGYRVMR